MSSTAGTINALGFTKNIDNLDLRPFDLCTTRALLIADTDFAEHCLQLQKNASLVTLMKSFDSSLLSSDLAETSNEKTLAKPSTLDDNTANSGEIQIHAWSCSIQRYLLAHPDDDDSEEECDICYINQQHCVLYPYPDRDALELHNTSASIFQYQRLSQSKIICDIPSGGTATLGYGSWRITLGEGLRFQIRVLDYHETSAISTLLLPLPRDGRGDRLEHAARKVRGVSSSSTTMYHSSSTQRSQMLSPPPEPQEATRATNNAQTTNSARTANRTQAIIDAPPANSAPPANDTQATNDATPTNNAQAANRAKGKCVVVKRHNRDTLINTANYWNHELNIIRDLDHPSVVKLLDFDAKDLSLTFEYGGLHLGNFVGSSMMSKLSVTTQSTIMLAISNALEYIHDQNIIHYDIKPENILIDELEKRPLLCDFGISQKLSTLQNSSTSKISGGTPAYVAPEYLLDQNRGMAGDIWAFGVTLLFVFGLIPLPCVSWNIAEATKKGEARNKMLKWLSEVEASVPAKGYPLLRQMLVTDVEERITASCLVSSLQSTLQKPSKRFKLAA